MENGSSPMRSFRLAIKRYLSGTGPKPVQEDIFQVLKGRGDSPERPKRVSKPRNTRTSTAVEINGVTVPGPPYVLQRRLKHPGYSTAMPKPDLSKWCHEHPPVERPAVMEAIVEKPIHEVPRSRSDQANKGRA